MAGMTSLRSWLTALPEPVKSPRRTRGRVPVTNIRARFEQLEDRFLLAGSIDAPTSTTSGAAGPQAGFEVLPTGQSTGQPVGSGAAGTVLAFPGAEGFGANTPGGRGGQVIEVTHLNDSGVGSLRAAIEAVGPRIVVFRVGGTIELQDELEITHPFITIAGQTAPGDGITIKNHDLRIDTHDVIIRYLRLRSGPGGSQDAVHVGDGAHNIILDHNSFSWATDENASATGGAHDVTFQWNIISEGLSNSTHPEGPHSRGSLFADSTNISVHHNLYAHNEARNPRIGNADNTYGTQTVDVVNNVIYNWGKRATEIKDFVQANIVNNYYRLGPDSTGYTVDGTPEVSVFGANATSRSIFIDGNVGPTCPAGCVDDWVMVGLSSGAPISVQQQSATRHEAPLVTTTTAEVAFDQVLASAGAILPARDSVDQRVIDDVVHGTGSIIDDPADVGGWPLFQSGTPPTDTDHDGSPDAWELLYGFDPDDPADGSQDADGDGYTNVEEYLNSTIPISEIPPSANDDVATTLVGTPVSVDVMANDDLGNPPTTIIGVTQPANGMVSIDTGGAAVTYSPTGLFAGTDVFTYTVQDHDGQTSTASVTVTVWQPNDPPTAADDQAVTDEDTAVVIDVLANDADPNDDPLTITAVTQGTFGTVTINPNQTVTYQPAANDHGSDSFTYTVSDSRGASQSANVLVTVAPINDAPVAEDDAATTNFEVPVTIDPLGNDSDVEDDDLVVSAVSDAGHGTVQINLDQSITYSPDPDFSGTDWFTYTVQDSGAATDSAAVSVTVMPPTHYLDVRIDSNDDDAEERDDGTVRLNSSDLELVFDRSDQHIGLRFNQVTIPPNATILEAYVQFQVDETGEDPTTLSVYGQAVDDAPEFEDSTSNISSRTPTLAAVMWTPPAWTTVEEAGIDQRTPNIAQVIQEIVGRPGWSSGNSLAVLINGSGERVAESHDGTASAAPLLHVAYTVIPNQSPVINDQSFPAIDEHSPAGTFVGTVSATDSDPGQSLSYSITGGNPGDAFTIHSSTGEVTIANAATVDFETTPTVSLNVLVTDSGVPINSDTAIVTIDLNDLNESPMLADQVLAVDENSPLHTVVGSIVASDPDFGQSLTYEIRSGNTGNAFAIDPLTGELTIATSAALDFEAMPSYDLTVDVLDDGIPNLADTATVTVNLNDVNEPPDIDDRSFVIDEHSPAGTLIGTVVAFDPDLGDELTYRVTGGNENGALALDGSTGAITVADRLVLDFESMPAIVLTVQVDDSGAVTLSDTATITVHLNNIEEPANTPPQIEAQVFSIAENSADATLVGSVIASDADAGQLLSFAITSGNIGDAFAIDATTGAVTVTNSAMLDFETTPEFMLEVQVTDDGFFNLSDTATVTISLIDDPENPPVMLAIPIATNDDDAEQQPSGAVRLGSRDLELVDGQTVGLRFALPIPAGVTISHAYIQFTTDEEKSGETTLTIEGEAADDALPFEQSDDNISSRPRTSAQVSWNPVPWTSVGQAGPEQQTPDISAVIQEIVNRPGWSADQALVLIITGDGVRTAETYDGEPNQAPVLHVEYLSSPPSDQPPTVDAGPDQTIVLPASAMLDGTVTDDGLGGGIVSIQWTQVGGPESVTFDDASSVDTAVTFPAPGTYVLRLTAADSQFTSSDEINVQVQAADTTISIERRVASSTDDAEERPSGAIDIDSSDLEFVEAQSDQTVGLRFNDIDVPQGATITNAYIQFQVDETSSQTTNLSIHGQADDDAPTFTTEDEDITSRPLTLTSVLWTPPEWDDVEDAGIDQQTPNIAAVIQEIVNRPGWASGNALVVIVSGLGKRVAESYDGLAEAAPLLVLEYSLVDAG